MRKMRPDLEDVLSTLLRIFLIDISATPHALALIRLANSAALFLPVLPTPLRGYCFAVRQNEKQLPCGSGETQGEAMPLHFTCHMKLDRANCHAEHIRFAQCKLREASRHPARRTLRCGSGWQERVIPRKKYVEDI